MVDEMIRWRLPSIHPVFHLILAALLLWAPVGAPIEATAEAVSFQGHAVERTLRANGLTVLLLEDHSEPLVSVMAGYRVGSVRERPGITGIAHFVEHMLFRATRELPGTEITRRIERAGGHWHGYTSFEVTTFSEVVASRHLGMLLHLESQRLSGALIPAAEVAAEREAVIAELRGYEGDPSSVLADAVSAIALTAHPLRYNVTGWVSDLNAITAKDLMTFYRAWYTPDRLVLGIVGDVSAAEVEMLVARYFDGIPAGPPREHVRTVEPEQTGPRRLAVSSGSAARRVQISWPAPALTTLAPLVMLDALLGGGGSLIHYYPYFEAVSPSSRLGRAGVRGDISFTTAWAATSTPYMYSIGADLEGSAGPQEAEGAIVSALREIAEHPPTTAELAAAVGRLHVGTASETSTYRGICQAMVFFETMGGLGHHEMLLEEVGRVTPTQVAGAAKALAPEVATTGWHLPKEEVARLRPRGLGPTQIKGTGRMARAATASAPLLPAPLPSFSGRSEWKRRRLENGLSVSAAGLGFGGMISARIRFEIGQQPQVTGASGGVATVRSAILASLRREGSEWAALLMAAGAAVTAVGLDDPGFARPDRIEFGIDLPASSSGILPRVIEAIVRPRLTGADIGQALDDTGDLDASLREDSFSLAPALALGMLRGLSEPFPASRASRSVIRARIDDWFRPERVSVAVAGDIEPSALIEALAVRFETIAGGVKGVKGVSGVRGSVAAPVPVVEAPSGAPVIRALPGKTQSMLAFALPAPAIGVPLRPAFELLAGVLHHGYGGRLGADIITKRGWAYSIASHLTRDGGEEAWVIRVGTDPARVAAVREGVIGHLESMFKSGPSDAEIEEARTMLLGHLAHRFETAARAAAWLIEAREPGEEEDRLQSITLEQIELARRYFDPAAARIAIVGVGA